MFRCLKVKMSEKGLTMIELLVAITVFTLVIGSAMGIFVSAIRSQREILATQKLLDETGYTLEYMSRALRMAKKDTDGSCLGEVGVPESQGYNYLNLGGDGSIAFINYHDKCQEFFLEDDQIKERISSGKNRANFGDPLPLTSGKLKVNTLIFKDPIDSWRQDDNNQPRVTIFLEIGKKPDLKPKISIQTTISQRNLDMK